MTNEVQEANAEIIELPKEEKSVFKVGDKVYHFTHGWGIIDVLDSFVTVSFNDKKIHFNHNTQLLSFTEYTLQGFSQERPIELPVEFPEDGELCLMRDSNEDKWQCKVFYKYIINPKGNIFVTDEGEGFNQIKRIKILD